MRIHELHSITRLYFGYEDIARALKISQESARVSASRYVRLGLLLRLKRNIYMLSERWRAAEPDRTVRAGKPGAEPLLHFAVVGTGLLRDNNPDPAGIYRIRGHKAHPGIVGGRRHFPVRQNQAGPLFRVCPAAGFLYRRSGEGVSGRHVSDVPRTVCARFRRHRQRETRSQGDRADEPEISAENQGDA